MGLGGAAIMPSTLSIIANVFDPRERGKAIGVWAGAVGLGVAIGPIVGGLLLEHFWWGSVFLINVPIVVVGVIAGQRARAGVEETRSPGRIDFVGVLLSIVGLAAAHRTASSTAASPASARRSRGAPDRLGVVVLAAFVCYERRTDHPSLDVRLFRNRQFSASIALVGMVFFAAMGALFFLRFYLQLVRGYTPLQAGALMLPFALGQLIFAPLQRRHGEAVRRQGGQHHRHAAWSPSAWPATCCIGAAHARSGSSA